MSSFSLFSYWLKLWCLRVKDQWKIRTHTETLSWKNYFTVSAKKGLKDRSQGCESGLDPDSMTFWIWIPDPDPDFEGLDPDWAKMLDPDPYWINPDPQPLVKHLYRAKVAQFFWYWCRYRYLLIGKWDYYSMWKEKAGNNSMYSILLFDSLIIRL
jgi:hypothetical protein